MIRIGLVVAALALPAPAAANFDWLGKIELAADGFKARDPKARVDAVRMLAKFDIRWTKKHLLKALRDPEPEVRRAAARLLGSHEIKSAIPVIMGWLTDPDNTSRSAAAEILGQLKAKKAVPALIRALGDPDDLVRVRAATALGQIKSKDAVIPLIGRLEDEKSTVRLAAVKALAAVGDSRAVVQLVGSFADASIDIRNEAVRAVGKLGDQAAVPPLLRLLRDRMVRSAAATALGDLTATSAISPLIRALNTERSDNSYRALVATALGRIAANSKTGPHARRSVEALVTALADSHMRKAAREALRIAGAVAVPALIDHLKGRLRGDPETAVALLRDLEDPRATDALVAELERGRIARSLVLEALSRSGDDRALVPILGLLRDKDPEVRMAAMVALEPLIQGDSRAADVVVNLLKDKDEAIQILAARYLGLMKALVATQPLIALAGKKDADKALRAAALHALGQIADKRGANAALTVLESGPPELHRPAATALVNMAPAAARDRLLALAGGKRADGTKAGSKGTTPARSRLQSLRALTAVVRDRPNASVRKQLTRLAKAGPTLTSQAAIDALGAMADPQSKNDLERLASHPDPSRRASAIVALARLSRRPATFMKALASRDDRVAGAAARALATVGIGKYTDALVAVARRGGFAAQINASAALARHLPAGRAPAVRPLLHHRNPLVRANAIFALGRLRAEGSRDRLVALLESDDSWLVRSAAARALSRLGQAREALQRAKKEDGHEQVRTEATRALDVVFKPGEPTEWRSFFFVDPSANNSAVSGQPYAIIGADGVGLGVYSDLRGEVLIEAFAPGDHTVKAADRISEL